MNILLQMKWIFQHDVILLIKQILKWTNETIGTYSITKSNYKLKDPRRY